MTPEQENNLKLARERAASLTNPGPLGSSPVISGPDAAANAGSPPFSSVAAPGPGVQTLIDPKTNTALPLAYANMGIVREFAPPPANQMVMMLLALSGAGKTTFVSSIPDSLVISFSDTGASSVIHPAAHRIWVRSYAEWDRLRTQLLADSKANRRFFKSISIDTQDEWFWIMAERVIANWNERYKKSCTEIGEVGQEGKGYGDTASLMEDEVVALTNAGYGVVLTGHLQEKTLSIGREKVTVIRPVLSNGCFKALLRKTYISANLIVVVQNTETQVREVEVPDPANPGQKKIVRTTAVVNLSPDKAIREYRLTVSTTASDDEKKARLFYLPDYIVVGRHGGWPAFLAAYNRAVELSTAEDQKLGKTS